MPTGSSKRRMIVERLETRRLLTNEVEPNGTILIATPLPINESLVGKIDSSGDIDFFKVTLNQGQKFSLSTINSSDSYTAPTLPAQFDFFEADGTLVAGSIDFIDQDDLGSLFYVAPKSADYFVRVSSKTRFGTYVDPYSVQTKVTNFVGVVEQEPNNEISTATLLVNGQPFQGSVTGTDPIDLFAIALNTNDVVSVDFSGLLSSSPGVRLLTSAGGVLASSLDGTGLVSAIPSSGNYYIEIGQNSRGSVVGQYVGVVSAGANGVSAPENGNGFDANSKWTIDQGNFNYMAGALSSIDDVDVYQFSTTDLSLLHFELGNGSIDSIADLGRTLVLSNSFGQPIVYSQTGSLALSFSDAIVAGTFFLTVNASSLSGLGAYLLQAYSWNYLSEQRDVTLHLVDFNQQIPAHRGYPWVSSYAVPKAEPFVVGMFESRYDIYDVDVTRTKPNDGTEFISSGYGNFGDIGAAGFGGGTPGIGQRRMSGATVNSAQEQSWDKISYETTETLMHEFGHAMGLPHARSSTAFMGYLNETEYIPIGTRFNFLRDDSRRPGELLENDRNYLDTRMQPGSQAMENEPNAVNAQSLDSNFLEMSFEISSMPELATGDRPIQTLSGDFNADGKADAAVVSADSNDLRVYLGDGSGKLTWKVTRTLDDLNWWEEPMAIGDFNRDGRSDVAVLSRNNNRIAIFLAALDGSLEAPTNLATGSLPNSLVATDVNRDGIVDLIAGTSTQQIAVHLGSSSGSFSTESLFNIGVNPWSMALADFNVDGSMDLVAVGNSKGVGIVYGNGTGQFGGLQTLVGTVFYRGVTAGDFNGDQKPDIAAVGRGEVGTTVFLREGSTFASGAQYEAMSAGEMITRTDINRDGILDLVIGGYSGGFAAGLLGNGDGTFGQAVDFDGGSAPTCVAVADFNGDSINDLLITSYSNNSLRVFLLKPNNPRNDRVTVHGDIAASVDIDRYSIRVQPGDVYTFDVDAAEFQYPIDAKMRILSSSGMVLATNNSALDRDSGLDSTDPFIKLTFGLADRITIEVSGENSTVGNYRLKVTPKRAFEVNGPRIIASLPDNGAILDGTNQLVFFTDSQIDPSSITNSTLIVRGSLNGVQAGTARFNPLDSTIVWTSASALPRDTYSVTLSGSANGVTDLQGALLDGEIATNFTFPLVSGDDNPGGDYVLRFTIDSIDALPAVVTRAIYERDPNQRGQFSLDFSDQLSFDSVLFENFVARGAGLDQLFGTSDDHVLALDSIYDKIYNAYSQSRLMLFTRGIPDPDQYRIEGSVLDAAGFRIVVRQNINVGVTVPNSALFQDSGLTKPGILASYVNRSLRTSTTHADWRSTQSISGSRIESNISFLGNKAGFADNSFGVRSQVGVTDGTDLNWENFSAQWDGWIDIPFDGVRLQTRSDEGSRMWIDVNGDGSFASNSIEFADNGFGLGHLIGTGTLFSPLAKGKYRIRVQYEEGTGNNAMVLEWVTPQRSGEEDGLGHGPTVIGLSVIPNAVTNTNTLDRLEVTFSGALDATTLTTQNFNLRYSSDPSFFDGNDVRIQDADNTITWNAVTHTATLIGSTPFPPGYYLIELDGGQSGIRAPNGWQLDGEFINNRIVGNTTAPGWSETPSGNGIAGGDYRAYFVITSSPAILELSLVSIRESDGTAVGTVKRSNPSDVSTSQVVRLKSSDTTAATVPDVAIIPAGEFSTTFTISAVNDSLVDGNQVTIITAWVSGVMGAAQVTVTDDDGAILMVSLTSGTIPENGGTTIGTITRSTQSSSALIVNLSSSDPTAATVPATVTIPVGSTSATFTVTAVNDVIADGNQSSIITASASGFVSG
ncbi:MAG: FG-GAP-like repeat-containing protein, partial [Planctomycetota bacterium]|nr:FG-GAP-like repeat-containing protein [Planctomycetota bacterium]